MKSGENSGARVLGKVREGKELSVCLVVVVVGGWVGKSWGVGDQEWSVGHRAHSVGMWSWRPKEEVYLPCT